MKIFKRTILLILVLFLLCELIARYVLGLGIVPVYVESKEYEYIYAPDQKVKRFGNLILTNQHGMRSDMVDTSAFLILGFGDSVINGGSQTDHDSLATSHLSKDLTASLKRRVQVLNISANSWGPDNAYAFLQKHGDFGSQVILLVFSSHDRYDNMHFQKVVGVHPAWPGKQPLTATTDALFKYMMPWLRSKLDPSYDEYSYLGIDMKKKLNTGWADFEAYAKANNKKLLVYIHPSKSEAAKGTYDKNGKALIEQLRKDSLHVIAPVAVFKSGDFYRDFIHLNNTGQRKLASLLYPELLALVQSGSSGTR